MSKQGLYQSKRYVLEKDFFIGFVVIFYDISQYCIWLDTIILLDTIDIKNRDVLNFYIKLNVIITFTNWTF